MDSLTIGYDAKKIIRNFTGIGNYSRAALRALSEFYPDNRYRLYTADGAAACRRPDELPLAPNIEYISPAGVMAAKPLHELWRCLTVKDRLAKEVDLYHGLSNELPLGVDKVCPSVVTIHDLIFMRYPHSFSVSARAILEYKTRRACHEASRIIAISHATSLDIQRIYGIPESRIDVVYQGCLDIFRHKASDVLKSEVRSLYGLPPEYVVAVGTLEWRKNQETLVRALKDVDPHLSLVLVGRGDAETRRLSALAESLGVADRLLILGNVPLAHLPALYQMATAAAYVSLIEGFGIPAVEAAASAVPLVAATGTCLEEAGGPSAIYCDPHSPAQMADAINHLYSHPDEARLRAKEAQLFSQNFLPANIADALMHVYRKTLR